MTIGTAGFASRIKGYMTSTSNWWRLHDTGTFTTQCLNTGMNNLAFTPNSTIVAYRGAISFRQAGPFHSSQTSYCMTFDGVSDAVEMVQTGSPLTGTSGTFFAWYKRSAASTAGTIMGGTTGNVAHEVGILSTGAPYVKNSITTVLDVTTTTATSGFTDDTSWHFLAITCDGISAPIIYIDGAACTASNVLTGAAVAGSWFTFGGTATACDIGRKANTGVNDGTVYFKGSLCDIGLLRGTVLSAAEVLYVYGGKNFGYSAASACFNDIIVEAYQQVLTTDTDTPALKNYLNCDEAADPVLNFGYRGTPAIDWAWITSDGGIAGATGSGMDVISRAIRQVGNPSEGITVASSGASRYLTYSTDLKGAVFMIVKCDVTQVFAGGNVFLWMAKADNSAGFQNYNAGYIDTNGKLGHSRVKAAGNHRIRTATNTSLYDGAYHFLAWVQNGDGTNSHMYIDGVEVSYSADTVAGTPPTVDDWTQHMFTFSSGVSYIMRGATNADTSGTLDHISFVANVSVTSADVLALQTARARTISSSAAIPTMIRHVGRKVFNF